MQGGGSAPTLDAASVGNNQQSANINSAINTQKLNQVDQITPFGNLTYANTGGTYDYNGNWIPKFSATTTLAPDQQKLLDQRSASQSGLFDLAKSFFPQASAALNTKLPTFGALPDTAAYTDNAYKALTARGTEDINRAEEAQKVQNANQGVATGSDAYNRALQPFERSRVDLSNQSTINADTLANSYINRDITGRNQQTQEALLRQQNPLQNYASLLSLAGGSTNPTFSSTPQTTVQAPDVTSPALAQFQSQVAQYQQGQQNSNALMGALFGLGGAAVGGTLAGPLGGKIGKGLFGIA